MTRFASVVALLIGLTAVSAYGYLQTTPFLEAGLNPLDFSTSEVFREVLVAWAFIGAGLIAWRRRARTAIGAMMMGVGAAWLLHGLEFLPTSPLVSIGVWLGSGAGLMGVLLGLLILTYPTGSIRSRAARTWIVLSLGYLVIRLGVMFVSPSARGNCDCRGTLILKYDQSLQLELVNLADLWFGAMTVILIAALAWRWSRSSAPARRGAAPVWIAGVVMLLIGVTGESFFTFADSIVDWHPVIPSLGDLVWGPRREAFYRDVLPWVQSVSLLLVPFALLWGLLRLRLRQSAVAALAVDLGRIDRPESLTAALRRALGDESLDVAYWSRPAGAYVDQMGEPVELHETEERSVTRLDGDDAPLAALIHDPALDEQRALVDGVAAVARLAIENERLHAEVRAQLEEVRASRERIVRATDDERRRVERNIHDGAQQRLVSLSLALTMAQAQMKEASPQAAATLAEAEQELKLAIGELRELARGIHPAILGEAGLTPALEALAERSPVPVRFRSVLAHRHSPLVEATAYFVAAEALTNVAKYASASSVELAAEEADGWLHVTVVDDGVGGADPSTGSGLRGLLDRVAAVGGRLSIESLAGRGTRLVADIPCE
jgi:signal transduction histidine kinase